MVENINPNIFIREVEEKDENGNVMIPKTQQYAIEKIDGCEEENLVLPAGVVAVDDHAAYNANIIADTLVIPKSIQTLGVSSFEGNYIKNVVFEEGSECFFVQENSLKGIKTPLFIVPDSVTVEVDSGIEAEVIIANQQNVRLTEEYSNRFEDSEELEGIVLTQTPQAVYNRRNQDESIEVKKERKALEILNEYALDFESDLYLGEKKVINTGFFWEIEEEESENE